MSEIKNIKIKKIKIKDFYISSEKLTFICGPCVIEDENHAFSSAKTLKEIFSKFENFNFIFKASFDKANRSSVNSFRGPGLEKGLEILNNIKTKLNLPILSDIHDPSQADLVKDVLDIIQIPAFLCRQTDLIIAAANTKKCINIKKGQYMSPWDMKNAIDKVLTTGNDNIFITERGSSFGYNNLVSDFRAIPIMKSFGYPVCFDASHSTQLPGGSKTSSSGQSEFIPFLAKAALSVGSNAIFIECHKNPNLSKSDRGSVMSFDNLEKLLNEINILYPAIKQLEKLC